MRESHETAMMRRREELLLREIPEVSEGVKRLNIIPLPNIFNKKKLAKKYKNYFIKQSSEYCDYD